MATSNIGRKLHRRMILNIQLHYQTNKNKQKQKLLKRHLISILGQAGSGKTLLAVQVALDMFFKRHINKIIITRPTVSNEDNGFLTWDL
jgi:phosphate starvation-inducible protein PhoH and related proteins